MGALSKITIPQEPSNYLKLDFGDNRVRILSEAIEGYEWFQVNEEGKNKPVRVRTLKEVPAEYLNATDWRNKAKYFVAFKVFNHQTNTVQIMELTQTGVIQMLESLEYDKGWGDIREYDINIRKDKTGQEAKDVEYTVVPQRNDLMDEGKFKFAESITVNLEKLYEGGDPFEETATGQAGSIKPSSKVVADDFLKEMEATAKDVS